VLHWYPDDGIHIRIELSFIHSHLQDHIPDCQQNN
jgi:hypothetical protein